MEFHLEDEWSFPAFCCQVQPIERCFTLVPAVAVQRATPTKAVDEKAGSKSKRGKQEMAGKEEARSAKAEAVFKNKKQAIVQGTDALKKVVLTSHTCSACVTAY